VPRYVENVLGPYISLYKVLGYPREFLGRGVP